MADRIDNLDAHNILKQDLARLITFIERVPEKVPEIMKSIFPHLGKASVIGITGPPGVGKSTLIDRMTKILRNEGLTLGIIAVDPTSPFSGGALLGDRIRMQQHSLDEGVFIRSLATRGNPGGLPVICHNVINLLDGFGKDFILVETVGVGQAELDVIQIVDTTVVVLAPECGDSIQAMKAGLLEIADIFVINKADSPGASRLVADLDMLVHRNPRQAWWETPILETQAVNNIGIDELISQIERRCRALQEDGRLSVRRKEQRRNEFLRITKKKIADRVIDSIEADPRLKKYLDQVETGELDPYTASEEILRSLDFPASRRDDHPTAGKSG